MGLIEGTEGYFEGDKAKIFRAGVWLTIGASGLVPGLQVPAMIAGMTMASVEAGSSYFDIRKDKDLLEAWIASGRWDEKNGLLLKLIDAKRVDHEVSFDGILRDGDVGYKAGLEGTTIRGFDIHICGAKWIRSQREAAVLPSITEGTLPGV